MSADPFNRDARFRDFRNFLFHCWTSLGYPPPTEMQYDFAEYLQNGPERCFLGAYRGFGKSWITVAFAIWSLYWNPDANVVMVSASQTHAASLSTFAFQLIRDVPGLSFLSCEGRDRHSKIQFDVGPARPNKQASVVALGITGQLAGNRADLVIPDDVEIPNNSLTQGQREILAERIKEFDAVVKPGGRIAYLGTPQSEASIYNLLASRGYAIRLWPVEYPDESLAAVQGEQLSPLIREKLAQGAKPGDPTDRFDALTIAKKKASYGTTGFALQFKLNTSLADVDRYPLKLRDLVIMDVPNDVGPEKVIWTNAPQNQLNLAAVGLNGDRFFGPILPEKVQWSPWQGTVMFIDPAGTGSDETGYAIVKHLNGILYCVECTGLAGGYSDPTLIALAGAAKRHGVNRIVVESNFGDGMYERLLQPHVAKVHPCSIEGIKVSKQKELRILDVLEPVINQHRLVMSPSIFERDAYRSGSLSVEQGPRYMLAYQITRITREKGSLAHDDRLDALAGAVACWTDAMAKDVDRSAQSARDALFQRDLETFVRAATDQEIKRPRTWITTNSAISHRR